MTLKSLSAVRDVPTSRLDARLSSREVHQALSEQELDPFLVVSLFEMSGPVFPPHPHAGFSVATYILPESPVGFINQDSLGTRNVIQPGGLHATVAGAGVLHEEQPVASGQPVLGYQIWIDHENAHRQVPPRPETLEADHVPMSRDAGVTKRVLIGDSGALRSPITLPTAVRLIDVELAPGAIWTEPVSAAERGFLVAVSGAFTVGGQAVHAGQVATLAASGTELRVEAGSAGARVTLFAGTPLNQPRVFGGPVVGATKAEVQLMLQAANAGRFGRLRPFAAG